MTLKRNAIDLALKPNQISVHLFFFGAQQGMFQAALKQFL